MTFLNEITFPNLHDTYELFRVDANRGKSKLNTFVTTHPNLTENSKRKHFSKLPKKY